MFGDILAKIANGEKLSQQELEVIQRQGNEVDTVSSLMRSFVQPGTSSLNLMMPIVKLYDDVLDQDYASFSVQIPGDFRHLLLFGKIRLTGIGLNVFEYVKMRFNDDSGTNYTGHLSYQVNTTVAGNQLFSQTGATVDFAPADGVEAGNASPFFGVIPSYASPFFKSVIAIDAATAAASTTLAMWHGLWKSADPISKITLYPETATYPNAKLVSGSVISIYGIR